MPASVLTVCVWRGAARGSLQTFEVPRFPSQTVLDVVTHIQRHLDPTLAYRYACRVGMCGSCAMVVNGRLSQRRSCFSWTTSRAPGSTGPGSGGSTRR